MAASNNSTWSSLVSDQTDILINIANNLASVEKLVVGAAYVMGLAFAFKAIYSLKTYTESRGAASQGASLKEPVVYLLVAAVFIYFPTVLRILLMTSFGSSNILQYASASNNNQAIITLFGTGSTVGGPLALIIQTIGVIAFVRGWILIARSVSHGQPPGGTGKGLIQVFAGILAMNIVATLEIVNNTLYGT